MIEKYLIKISGICGILLPIVTIIILFLSILNSSCFSLTDHAISDLGRLDFGVIFFNYGIIFAGLLLLVFSIGLYFSPDGERLGPTIFSLSSIFFIGIGIFYLPNPNHIYFSGLFFIAFPLGFLFIGLQFFKKASKFIRKMGFFAFVVVALSFISSIFLFIFKGIAIPECIIIFSGFIWCMIYSLNLLLSK